MNSCHQCSKPVAPTDATCPSCGADLGALDATRVSNSGAYDATRASGDPTHFVSHPSAPAAGERFAPGTVIRERYRIVGMLGRGGMGEVYRADDLKLGHSVALKFLPAGLESDPDRLRRFLDEVRTARQVTHAHVCRVHDVDEVGGHHFLSMEYVDGEDLASSLRRVGRLPEERAVDVARQICAGLAAAHEAGVLHRDLKPANVMLDGRGQVKLTDFGLASLAEDLSDEDIRAGTPAYMAPEQLSGTESTRASDIYALGLVLFELFTGRPVFQAETLAELTSLHATGVPSRPTDHVGTLDPAVEAIVMRCLEKEPSRRPPSALAVAAGLPGGDPLAAALAAGETPSPELLAEVGEREALRPIAAMALGALALLLTLGGSWWAAQQSLIAVMPFEKPPAVLEDQALELINELDYTEDAYSDPVDTAWGWLLWNDVLRAVDENDSITTDARWELVRDRPDAGGYWYRQSPLPYMPAHRTDAVVIRGSVTLTNPPQTVPGELSVLFDLDGSLRRFETMPRRFTSEPAAEPDWNPLFEAAELDTARFRPVPPRYSRYMQSDLRRAWVGTIEGQPGVEYRVDAGASEGRAILFNVSEATSLEDLGTPPAPRRLPVTEVALNQLPPVLILVIVVLVIGLTRRNASRGRVDLRGAVRFGTAVFTTFLVSNLLRSHSVFGPEFGGESWHLFASSVFVGFAGWAMYIAVEPIGRRVWPTMFVSTSRCLSREHVVLRDALLGRSVLIGMIAGGAWFTLIEPGVRALRVATESPGPWPFWINLSLLEGGRIALAQILDVPMVMLFVFLQISALVLVQGAVKRRFLAAAIGVVIWAVIDGISSPLSLVTALATATFLMVVLLRFGALALIVTHLTISLIWHARAVDYSHWTAEGALIAVGALVVVAAYGVWASTGRSTTS